MYAQTNKIKPRQTVGSKLTHQITKVFCYDHDWITDTEWNDSNTFILTIKSAHFEGYAVHSM